MTAIAWTNIENAVHDWVRQSSDLDAENIIWDYQMGKRPSMPYIELAIEEFGGRGDDWRSRSYDSGEDKLILKSHGHRVISLVIQCFGRPVDRTSSPVPAMPILSEVISAIDLHAYGLDIAGVGVGTVGKVQSVPGHRGNILEPRARVDVQLHVASNLEVHVDYVKRFQITTTAKNVEGSTLEVNEQWVPDAPEET